MTRKQKADPEEMQEIALAEVEEPWPPTGPIVVYQDQHNAPATILKANDDGTLDLLTDLYGLGREMTLYGVARRQGSGNGWELV